MKKSGLKQKLENSPEEEFDDKIENCVVCKKKGITKYNHKSVCAKHFVEIEDEMCMKSRLLDDVNKFRKIKEPLEIQKEIKKQMPGLYEELGGYFEV